MSAVSTPINVALEAFHLEENEPVAAVGREVEVQFEKAAVEQKSVPPFADAAGAEEGRRGEERHHAIQQALRQFAPDSAVHSGAAAAATGAGNYGAI